jgi:hypothetical protein
MYQHFFGDKVSLCIMCFYALPKKTNFFMLNPIQAALQMMLLAATCNKKSLLCYARQSLAWFNCFVGGFFFFVWVWWFAGHHKNASECSCFWVCFVFLRLYGVANAFLSTHPT